MEMEKVLEEVIAIAEKYNTIGNIVTAAEAMKKYQAIVQHLYGLQRPPKDVEEEAIIRLRNFYEAHKHGGKNGTRTKQ